MTNREGAPLETPVDVFVHQVRKNSIDSLEYYKKCISLNTPVIRFSKSLRVMLDAHALFHNSDNSRVISFFHFPIELHQLFCYWVNILIADIIPDFSSQHSAT